MFKGLKSLLKSDSSVETITYTEPIPYVGPLSIEILKRYPNLKEIYFERPRFERDPKSIEPLRNITRIGGHLKRLILICSHFEGNVSELAELRSLEVLNLIENEYIIGNLAFVSEMTGLGDLHLDSPSITGDVLSITNLTSLLGLNLHCPNLAGSIPESIGNLTKLNHLNLQGSNFTGILPTQVSLLTNLRFLHVNDNQLECSEDVIDGFDSLNTLTNLLNCKLLQRDSAVNTVIIQKASYSLGNLMKNTVHNRNLRIYDQDFFTNDIWEDSVRLELDQIEGDADKLIFLYDKVEESSSPLLGGKRRRTKKKRTRLKKKQVLRSKRKCKRKSTKLYRRF